MDDTIGQDQIIGQNQTQTDYAELVKALRSNWLSASDINAQTTNTLINLFNYLNQSTSTDAGTYTTSTTEYKYF